MNVKWIKLSTQMFEDEKIRLIENMPEADTILIIWVKLLAQAGKTNASGYIYLSEKIPYTDEMLATIFNRPLNVVRLALKTFEQFGMIEVEDNFINISNWEKHQNVEGLEKIRKQTRKRVARHREKKKLESGNVTEDVTLRNATEEDIDIEEDIEIDKNIYVEVINYLNNKTGKRFSSKSAANKKIINGRISEGRTLKDFIHVIDVKCEEWLDDPKWSEYLRPSTLFRPTNFENYLNQKMKSDQGQVKTDHRDKEIAFQEWVQNGNDPDEFDWGS